MNTVSSGFQNQLTRLAEMSGKQEKQQVEIKTSVNTEIAALKTLEARLTALQTEFLKLDHSADFLSRTTSTGITDANSLILTATAGGSALSGEYAFEVVQLATKSLRTGSSDVGGQMSPTSDVSGLTISAMPVSLDVTDGTFMINGAQVTVATTDSLQDVFDAISTATGATVTAAYNATTDKVELSGSGEIALGSPADTSNFLKVMKLYGNATSSVSSEASLGVVDLSSGISSANLAITPTTGSFKINGVSFSYDVDADSLASIIQQVNSSNAGVKINYDAVQDRFFISNSDEGKLDIAVEDTTGNLLETLGLNLTATLVRGDNAQFRVNGEPSGTPLTSTSNSIDSTAHGVDGLVVNAKKVGTDTITVAQNTTEPRASIESFIKKYNEVQSFIKDQTKVSIAGDGTITKGPLRSNTGARQIARDMRTMVFNAVTGMSGDIKRLADLGIDFKKDSDELEVSDGATLDNALAKDIYKVVSLFTDATDGISVRYATFLENNLKTGSQLGQSREYLEKKIVKIDAKIAKIKKEWEDVQRKTEMSFDQVQLSMQQMQQQMQQLAGLPRIN